MCVCVCVWYLDLQAEGLPVRLPWKLKHVPQLFVLEIPAEMKSHEEAAEAHQLLPVSPSHRVALLHRPLVQHRPDD